MTIKSDAQDKFLVECGILSCMKEATRICCGRCNSVMIVCRLHTFIIKAPLACE